MPSTAEASARIVHHANTRKVAQLLAAVELAARLAKELSRPHRRNCPCGVCRCRDPKGASADLGELADTFGYQCELVRPYCR